MIFKDLTEVEEDEYAEDKTNLRCNVYFVE